VTGERQAGFSTKLWLSGHGARNALPAAKKEAALADGLSGGFGET
jgi:hypothetical protein